MQFHQLSEMELFSSFFNLSKISRLLGFALLYYNEVG